MPRSRVLLSIIIREVCIKLANCAASIVHGLYAMRRVSLLLSRTIYRLDDSCRLFAVVAVRRQRSRRLIKARFFGSLSRPPLAQWNSSLLTSRNPKYSCLFLTNFGSKSFRGRIQSFIKIIAFIKIFRNFYLIYVLCMCDVRRQSWIIGNNQKRTKGDATELFGWLWKNCVVSFDCWKNARRHVLHFSRIEGTNYAEQHPILPQPVCKHHSVIRT